MSPLPARPRAGFTIVEALAAGIILALAAGLVGMVVSSCYGALADARDYREAAGLLDELLTKVDMIGPSRIASEGPWQGRFEAPHDRYSWTTQVRTRPEGHLYEVTVTVNWTGRGGEAQARIQTRLNDPPNSRNPAWRWSDL